jgi:hypothetical protein
MIFRVLGDGSIQSLLTVRSRKYIPYGPKTRFR